MLKLQDNSFMLAYNFFLFLMKPFLEDHPEKEVNWGQNLQDCHAWCL